MRELFFTVSLNISLLFFAIYAILGKSFNIDTDSFIYIITSVSFAIISILIVIIDQFKSPKPFIVRKINLFFYSLPLIFCFFYLIENPTSENGFRYFSIYLTFSLPAIFIGLNIAINNLLPKMIKWWELIMLILSLALFLSIPNILITNVISIGGGLDYQRISYLAAFAYCLNLYLILYGSNHNRFIFCYSKTYKVLSILLLILQTAIVFISGGRGGFILLLISTFVLIYLKLKVGFNYKLFIKGLLLATLFMFLFFRSAPPELLEVIEKGNKRLFAYFTPYGINFSETSGRDIYYAKAVEVVKDRPINGYGIFGYVDRTGDYPHNLILEILLQGGIFLLFIWIVIFTKFYKKVKYLISTDSTNMIIIPLFIYPLVELLFSGSYLLSPLYWFVLSYVFSYNLQAKKYDLNHLLISKS